MTAGLPMFFICPLILFYSGHIARFFYIPKKGEINKKFVTVLREVYLQFFIAF